MLRTKSLNELVTAGNKIKINDSRIVSILIVRTSWMKIFLKISLNFSWSFLPRFIVTQDLLQAFSSFLVLSMRFFSYYRKPWTWAFLNHVLAWPPNGIENFITYLPLFLYALTRPFKIINIFISEQSLESQWVIFVQ